MRETIKNDLKEFLENRTVLDVPGNSLLIYHKGKEVFRHYTGDVDKDTIFRIYSMTKVVTVVAALQLLERGKFTMDEPVSAYIPEYKNTYVWDQEKQAPVLAERPIRIRDLFCMSSGLTYEGTHEETPRQLLKLKNEMKAAFPGEGYTTLSYIKRLPEAAFAFQPGEHWCYGLSHDALGALIEVWSGETLGEYMKHHIFEPLGMKHTFFRCPESLKPHMASISDANASDDTKYTETARYESGGGGLLSTLDDYMCFAEALTHGGTSLDGVRILGRKTVELLAMDQLSAELKKDFNWSYLKGYSYGLGVRTMIDPAVSGIPGSVGEFGWCGVLGTWVLMDPKEELTVVYMHQRFPNLEEYVQTHLRAMIYGAIES